jgi:putative thioredoxin
MPSSSPWIRDVTADTFQTDVVEPSLERPVLVDFWAPWCGPCQTLGPLLEKLVQEWQGKVHLAKVNVDDEQELAAYFRISSIPAVKVIANGQLVHQFEGALPESELRRFLDEIAPSGDPVLVKAQAAEMSAPAKAEKEYRDILAKDPENDSARLGLARVLLAQDRLGEIAEVLGPVSVEGETAAEAERIKAQVYLKEAARGLPADVDLRKRIDANPRDAQARLELGIVLAGKDAYPEALAMLLSAAELDMKLASGRAREIMVKVFYAIGTSHPLANDYRSRLSRLLY